MQQIQIPNKILLAFKQWQRILALYGGRGGAKSESMARISLKESMANRHKILCGREYQNSISDSVKGLLEETIDLYEMTGFKVTDNSIIYRKTGSEYIFKGLKRETVSSIKSIPNITLAWIEEANTISKSSITKLTPTIRHKNSKIAFTFNIDDETDPVYQNYVLTPRDDTIVCKVNYYDNPWFDDPLKSEMLWDKENDYEKYRHVWEGEPIQHSEDQVMYGKWEIKEFDTPEGAEFFHGIDWGFSNDELAGVRSYILDDCLYIDKEAYKIKVEITDNGSYLKECIPTIKDWKSRADSARPETISHLNDKDGFHITHSIKGKGSIEDGISKLRGFKRIYIHPSCVNTIMEFRLYKWKKNRLTDENTRIPEDKHNHIIDALRYSLELYNRNTAQIIIPDKRFY